MPEKLDRCVQQVMADGKSEDSAYAICTAAIEGSARPDGIDDKTWNLALESIKDMSRSHFIFSQLSVDNLAPGKAFDGLTVVETLDMNGRPVTVTAAELPLYLANTQAAIKAAVSQSGELVGLPIDAGKTGDHDKGDAGGWIVGVELAGNVLRLVPKWTELGKDLIGKSIRRFFSATIDTVNKVILGGTLTNWPAVRDAQGKMLLKPIELSSSLYELADAIPHGKAETAMDEAMTQQITQAFMDMMTTAYPDEMPEVMSVDETGVVCKLNDGVYKVPYTMDASGPVFAPREQWETVEPTVIEAAMKFLSGLFKKPQLQRKESEMKLSDLTQAEREKLVTELAAKLQTTDGGQLSELAAKLIKDTREQALAEFRQQAERVQREGGIAELSTRLVQGSPDAPRGLKNVTADDLNKHLAALPADESKFFGDVLSGIVKDGLMEFTELGHGRKVTALQPVPDFAKASLTAALKAGSTAAKYFELAGLGDPTHYDLTPFADVKPANGKDK